MNDSQKNVGQHDLTDKDFYQQACSYFYYHAEQRTTMINFFIAVFAASMALYGSLITEYSLASTLIAIFLFIVSLLFYNIDLRNRFDVKQSQNVIEQIERFYSVNAPTKDAPDCAFGVFSNEAATFRLYSKKGYRGKGDDEYNEARKLYKKIIKQKKKGKMSAALTLDEERLNDAIERLAERSGSVSKKEILSSLSSDNIITLSFSIKMLYLVCTAISFLSFIFALLVTLRLI